MSPRRAGRQRSLERARLFKPFVTWVWGGCVLMAIGGLTALLDRRYRLLARREAVQGARVAV